MIAPLRRGNAIFYASACQEFPLPAYQARSGAAKAQKPSKVEPNNQTAPGTGTAETWYNEVVSLPALATAR